MNKHRHQVALTFAVLLGGVHLAWSALVLLGLAQPLINFVLWAHMIETGTQVGPFDLGAAITLVIVTALVGYAVGYIGASVWARVRA